MRSACSRTVLSVRSERARWYLVSRYVQRAWNALLGVRYVTVRIAVVRLVCDVRCRGCATGKKGLAGRDAKIVITPQSQVT